MRFLNFAVVFPALVLSGHGLAQTTCYTDPHGTTLCSSPGTVVQGNTNSVGSSIYRDDRGNLLEFQTDQFGNASVQLKSGQPIHWSAPVLGRRKYPFSDLSRPLPAPGRKSGSTPAGIAPLVAPTLGPQ